MTLTVFSAATAATLCAALAAAQDARERNLAQGRSAIERIADRLHQGTGLDTIVSTGPSGTMLAIGRGMTGRASRGVHVGRLAARPDGTIVGGVMDARCRMRLYDGRASDVARDLDFHAFPQPGRCGPIPA